MARDDGCGSCRWSSLRRRFKGATRAFKGARVSLKKTVAPLNTLKGPKHENSAYISQMFKRASLVFKGAKLFKRFKGVKRANA